LGGLNGSWKYKPRGSFLYEQEEVEKMLANFPPVDVFITHNSTRRIHGIHTGFDGISSYIERTQPQLVIHGHQHINCEARIGSTRVIGAYGHRLLEY